MLQTIFRLCRLPRAKIEIEQSLFRVDRILLLSRIKYDVQKAKYFFKLASCKGSLPTLKSMIIFISLVRIDVLFLISQGFRPARRCRFLPHLPTAKKIVLAISATPIISTLFLPWPVSFPLILPGLCKFGGGKCISQVIHASFFYGYGTGPAQQGKKYFYLCYLWSHPKQSFNTYTLHKLRRSILEFQVPW